MARCALCDAPIIWGRTAEGKGLPVNAVPQPNGNAWFEDKVLHIASKNNPPPEGVRRFSPHFVNCEPYKVKKRIEKALRET